MKNNVILPPSTPSEFVLFSGGDFSYSWLSHFGNEEDFPFELAGGIEKQEDVSDKFTLLQWAQ
jgi:hypothetical protein